MHMMYLGIGMLASQFHNTRGMWFVAIFSPVRPTPSTTLVGGEVGCFPTDTACRWVVGSITRIRGDARVLPVVASRASGGMHGCCRSSGRARSARLAPDPVAPHTTLSKKVEPHAHDVFRHWDACIPIP